MITNCCEIVMKIGKNGEKNGKTYKILEFIVQKKNKKEEIYFSFTSLVVELFYFYDNIGD